MDHITTSQKKCDDKHYGLKDQEELARRHNMLITPNAPEHIAPLVDFVEKIRNNPDNPVGRQVPHFDPCDGGINARVLILLSDPGPQVSHTGLISRNNPDPTAGNLRQLLIKANIDRVETVIWNFIPWHLDGRATNNDDRTQAEKSFSNLMKLLEKVEIIVLCGDEAKRAIKWLPDNRSFSVFTTCHPGNIAKNAYPKNWKLIEPIFVTISMKLNYKKHTIDAIGAGLAAAERGELKSAEQIYEELKAKYNIHDLNVTPPPSAASLESAATPAARAGSRLG